MYQIDKTSNNLIKLEERLFGELGIRERDHLQEWIAKNPEVLGEELLIIQKEFSGFNDTNERLDLLALDKDGNLVIIENKLDDTGRNVTWQALKYTSYCSTLTNREIINLYQQYLVSQGSEDDAKESILEFLDQEDDEELLLNSGDQRIVFVANNYRKEVTSTVLWLLGHDIKIQCFRATPYSKGEEMFLQIEQIIPLPETEEFMIDAKEKQKEKKGKSEAVEKSRTLLINFWSALKKNLKEHNIHHLDQVSAKPHYNIGFWKGQARFGYNLARKNNRVEMYFNNDPDKRLFNAMYTHKDEIEKAFGEELMWQLLETKKASRIKFEMPVELIGGSFREFTEENWHIRTDWFREAMERFYSAIYPVWEKVQKEL